MKSNKPSKKNSKHSDIEKNDIGSQFGKGTKKDKSAKKRLSIYDEFDEDEESFDTDFDYESDDDSYDDDNFDDYDDDEEED